MSSNLSEIIRIAFVTPYLKYGSSMNESLRLSEFKTGYENRKKHEFLQFQFLDSRSKHVQQKQRT